MFLGLVLEGVRPEIFTTMFFLEKLSLLMTDDVSYYQSILNDYNDGFGSLLLLDRGDHEIYFRLKTLSLETFSKRNMELPALYLMSSVIEMSDE